MLMWGQADTAKAWWQMEQAVMAGLVFHYLDEKPGSPYLAMADGTLNFFMTHFVDHTYGEVYENRTKYGAQIWDTNKGSSGKAAYHSTELGYYIYLYGNLLLKQKPVTLHYFFAPAGSARSLRMMPISFPTSIMAVTLDGAPYSSWDLAASTLQIPANVGGEFAVTYGLRTTDVGGSETAALPERLRLEQNYPNPFNPSTAITFALPQEGRVVIRVYDLLGRAVATVLDAVEAAGEHTIRFDGSGLASGVYLYRVEANGARLTRKMVLMR
jgi:hypothetical protein